MGSYWSHGGGGYETVSWVEYLNCCCVKRHNVTDWQWIVENLSLHRLCAPAGKY